MSAIIDVIGFVGLFLISYIIVSLIVKINKCVNSPIKLDSRILKELEED